MIHKLTLIEKDTGKVLFDAEVYLQSWGLHTHRGHSETISMMGRMEPIEFVSPPVTELDLRVIMIPSFAQSKRVHDSAIDYFGKPKQCDHVWSKYEGLVENYEYCTVCNTKRS